MRECHLCDLITCVREIQWNQLSDKGGDRVILVEFNSALISFCCYKNDDDFTDKKHSIRLNMHLTKFSRLRRFSMAEYFYVQTLYSVVSI